MFRRNHTTVMFDAMSQKQATGSNPWLRSRTQVIGNCLEALRTINKLTIASKEAPTVHSPKQYPVLLPIMCVTHPWRSQHDKNFMLHCIPLTERGSQTANTSSINQNMAFQSGFHHPVSVCGSLITQ